MSAFHKVNSRDNCFMILQILRNIYIFLKHIFLKITMAACLVESNCDILCDFGSCVSQMSSSESMILTDVNKFQTTQVIWQAGTCLVQLKNRRFYITYSFLSDWFVYWIY